MDSLSVLKNKPEIRFAGFDGNWEQRKCGSFATESCEKGHTGSIAKKLTVKLHANGVCEAGEITQGSDNTQYYVRHAGQFIYGKQNFFNGAIGVVPESLDKYESTKDVPAFDIDKIVDVDWFCHYMTRPEIYKPQELNCTGTGSKRFHVNSFFDMSILAPCLQEQQAIGKTFTNLNHLIILHQRKCDRLQALKKAMLEKMFPKAGSDVPEIRFAGFTDAWEQRKLGDMMNVTSVKRIHQSDWTDSGVRFLRARDIVAAAKNEEPDDYLYISKEKYEEYSALSGKVGVSDLLVTGVGTIGVPYLVRNLEPLYFKDGNIIWFQNSDKIDGKFLFYSFSAEQIQGFINESAGIGTVGTYTIESGKKTPISLPNQIEQAKVGDFFQQLDNLITLHQRKLQKLQECKTALLEKMFVG